MGRIGGALLGAVKAASLAVLGVMVVLLYFLVWLQEKE